MDSRRLFYLSLTLYVLSLVLPVKGEWLSGLGFMIVSGLWSLLTISHIAPTFTNEQFSFGALVLLLPFFNVSYFWAVSRFNKYNALITPSSAVLLICTLIALVYAILIMLSGVWELYIYLIWCAALVSLVVAIFLKWREV